MLHNRQSDFLFSLFYVIFSQNIKQISFPFVKLKSLIGFGDGNSLRMLLDVNPKIIQNLLPPDPELNTKTVVQNPSAPHWM
jgi:hypothetical protein